MSKFEVQHYTLCDGWVNTWTTYDDDGKEIPSLFESYSQALIELDDFLENEHEAFIQGWIESKYTSDEFRIVEVK